MDVGVNKVTIEFDNGFVWTIGDKNFDFKLLNHELRLIKKQRGIKRQISEPIRTKITEEMYG